MTAFGIEALNAYGALACIGVRTLFEGRRLNLEGLPNLMMEKRSVNLPFEDPVTNAVNAAKPILDRLDDEERDRIEVLVTSSESGLDYSKSIASYVHEHLGLSRRCRFIEAKQACYAATGALLLALGYVASGISPGAKALVIATDVTLVDALGEHAEPTMGAGAAAMLLGDQPHVMEVDLGAFGLHSYETMDAARPSLDYDIVDVDKSLFSYLDCLSSSFRDNCRRVDDVDFSATFDFLAFHTPFAGLVKAAHRKMMGEHCTRDRGVIEHDFERRMGPSLVYPSLVGNLLAGSLYLSLCSLIDQATSGVDGPRRVGLFSYGSGCCSEFLSGLIDDGSRAALRELAIDERLRRRYTLSFEEYVELLAENVRCLRPERKKDIDIARYEPYMTGSRRNGERVLALTGVREFHRQYEWL